MSNSNEKDEIEEVKTFTIEEAVKIQKAKRDQRNKEFYAKLAELKAKTAALKKQYYDKKDKRT
ncbi:hypothetical protein [Bacillus cereus]|uniref:hypothetical protein n=1 Tax=Bacillus cereus TaxID=1396 RepID=UPI000BF68BD9|nr:hypothetical protein [Bacillus cereus]PFO78870.1 hypothetical protein COJ77_20940 [Bacillus cereus]